MKQFNELKNPYKKSNLKTTLKRNYIEALEDNNFVKLVNSLNVEEEYLEKYTSKLENTVKELGNCKGCKGLEFCKNKVIGHVEYPKEEENTLVFVFKPCKYEKSKIKIENNVTFFETPKFLREASMSEIIREKERLEIIKYIKGFLDKFEKNEHEKGIYLHGSFGSGKSYIISALLNELSKKNVKCVNVYFPSLLRSLKESFYESFEDKINEIINSEVLLLDDIGAEKNTEWSRDEILGTILQYRMDNNLPTFFTSNLSIEELEDHLKLTSKSVDNIKARRIIERIKQLTIDMELISVNKR